MPEPTRAGWTFVEGEAPGPPSICSSCGRNFHLRRYYNLPGMPSYLDCRECRLTWELPLTPSVIEVQQALSDQDLAELKERWEGPARGLLTAEEHAALDLTGKLMGAFARLVGDAHTRGADLDEIASQVHVLQNAILRQAAARAYPDRYRLLGGPPPTGPETPPTGP